MKTDIAIIGGGPIGSLAAISAMSMKKAVTIFEQRKEIGVPDHCAGLLSKNGLSTLGLSKLPKEIIQNETIKGAKFYSPSGYCFEVKRNNTQAYVVNRTLFDQYLASKAENLGVQIYRNNKVSSLKFTNERQIQFKIKDKRNGQTNNVNSFVSIIAEGRKAILTKELGFKVPTKGKLLSGYQCLIENVDDLDTEFVELFLSNRIAPGFFAWIIPINDSTAKVGLASNSKLSVTRLKYLLYKNPLTKERFRNSTILKQFGGEVIVGGLLKRTSTDGILIAGDAARQTKATTGGGVITGGIAGVLAGKIAALSVEHNDNSKYFLKQYDNLWEPKLRTQLKFMSLFRWLLNKLNDKALDLAVKTVIENNFMEIIEQKADIDSQAEIIISLLKQPEVFKLLLNILPHLQW